MQTNISFKVRLQHASALILQLHSYQKTLLYHQITMSDEEYLFDHVAGSLEDVETKDRIVKKFEQSLQIDFEATKNEDFEIINTIRYDPSLPNVDEQLQGRQRLPWYLVGKSDDEISQFNKKCENLWLFHNHMERLKVSVAFFGWDVEIDAEAILDEILTAVKYSKTEGPLKVRALVSSTGKLTIETAKVAERPDLLSGFTSAPTYKVYLSSKPIDVGPFTCFKTTKRDQYNAARAEYISSAGSEEVMFVNGQGEVTEGSITNIAIVVNEMWTTPKVTTGCLMGVTRRHLIDSGKVFEGSVAREDLQEGEEVLIFNAVNGVSKGVIVLPK